MAIASSRYTSVRERYANLTKQYGAIKKKDGPRIAPFQPHRTGGRAGTGLPNSYGSLADKERIRHESGLGTRKPTRGRAEQYSGRGRAMTTQEKKFYAKIKEEDAKKASSYGAHKARGGTVKEWLHRDKSSGKKPSGPKLNAQGQARARLRESIASSTRTVRKPGEGLYTSRAATAEDLDKKGNLPTKTLAQEKRYAQFRKG